MPLRPASVTQVGRQRLGNPLLHAVPLPPAAARCRPDYIGPTARGRQGMGRLACGKRPCMALFFTLHSCIMSLLVILSFPISHWLEPNNVRSGR